MATEHSTAATTATAAVAAPRLEIRGVRKEFGTTVALDHIDLQPVDGEFMTILGPSGCGKTTLLRLVAGFELPTAGEVLMTGRVVSDGTRGVVVPPEERDIGMVFQTYAVWPHMTVAQNIAYPLKLAKRPREERRRRVAEVLELVNLSGFDDRLPSQLSGGQQQRVALARALAPEPNLLLLDEPLSNLDAKLRERMRRDLRLIQQEVGITTILVTHDQDEAIELSDRIVVMSDGEIQQVGPPESLYRAPANEFVADFLGAANVLPGEPLGDGWRLPNGAVITTAHPPPRDATKAVVRPEDLDLVDAGDDAAVQVRLFSGASATYVLTCGELELVASTRTDLSADRGDRVGLHARQAHYLHD